ncbi:MAG: endolytic transglycosylase MltG [Thermoleophilaceae bacterium]
MSSAGPPDVPGGPPEVPGRSSARERSAEARERARQARDARRARGRAGFNGGRGRAEPPADDAFGDDESPRSEPPSRPPSSRTRARRRGAALLGAVVLIGALVVGWAVVSYYQPFTGDGEGRVQVSIPSGATVSTIAGILETRGVISSPFFFETRARLTDRGTTLRPGSYTLRRGASNQAVLDVLAAGPPPDVVSVTVPEGRARSEVAPIVSGAGLGRGYRRATAGAFGGFDPATYGAPKGSSLEGFLFPSTYELRRDDDARELVRRQTEAFEREARNLDFDGAPGERTPYEVLTVASMVEREAQVDRERPLIASVIYNRLKIDELLRIDATVRFATGNWSRPILKSQLESPDPYNTYTNAGLPPGPIGSPGRESLEAAANPANTDFMFYVVKPGTCGEHSFSDNEDQFFRDSNRYNDARAARGGRSPTDC